MTIFAPGALAGRQTIIKGRVSEAVTGRTLAPTSAALEFTHAAKSGFLPATLLAKPGGYFALHLSPGRAMPGLTGHGPVTLKLTLGFSGRAPVNVSKNFPEVQLSIIDRPVEVASTLLVTRVVSGAPFVFDIVVPAVAVGLRGIVLKKTDPDQPLANVSVKAGNLAPVLTGANGRFAIDALPVTETVDLVLQGTGQPVNVTFRPDYLTPVNTVTLSLAG
jgi:hypothetical protein